MPQMPRETDQRGVRWREGPREHRPTGGIVSRAQTMRNWRTRGALSWCPIAVVAAIGFAAIAPVTVSAHEQSRPGVGPPIELTTFEVNTDRIQTTLLEVR